MTFTVRLPLPSIDLSPNARVHWAVKARATKAYRAACALAFRVARPRDWKACPVVIDIEYRAHRWCGGYHPKDPDNAISSLKGNFDAMKDAGIVRSDARAQLQWGSFKFLTTKRDVEKAGGPGVFITVRAQQ